MSEASQPHDVLSFGEKLLGIEGFNAERAQRYRKEMETLLVHRISRHERWGLGIGGALIGAFMISGAFAMSSAKTRPQYDGFEAARWTISIGCGLSGVLLSGWLLRVAIWGGYARRLGDVMGMLIAVIFCGGWGAGFTMLGFANDNPGLRMKLMSAGVFLLFVVAGCFMMAVLQWMHRQTQEKLLRIEYHLAELMERRD
jgi:hypothetical protein